MCTLIIQDSLQVIFSASIIWSSTNSIIIILIDTEKFEFISKFNLSSKVQHVIVK